jgi:glycosyltransferase involved in cell wall biosynthesis
MKDRLKILFFQQTPCIRNIKMATALTSKGHSISLVYIGLGPGEKFPGMDERIYDNKIHVKNLIHFHNEPDYWTVAGLCLAKIPIIHDVHDLRSQQIRPTIEETIFEGLANRASTERVYVSEYQMLTANRLYRIDIERSMVFPNYVCESMLPKRFHKKLSAADGEIHIVYEGKIVLESKGHHHRRFYPLFQGLARNKIHVHIYPSDEDTFLDCEREMILEEKSKEGSYIHWHNSMSPWEIVEEMTKYDFGILPFPVNEREDVEHLNSTLPNKLFEYLAAGLPVISRDLISLRNFIEKEKVGFVFDTIDDIIQRIERFRGLEVRGKRYVMEDEVDRLVEFYYKIIDYYWAKRR